MPALRTDQPCNVVFTTHGNKRLDSAAEPGVESQVTPCGFCGGGTGTSFSPCKSIVFPLHVMKPYRWSRGIPPFILNFGVRCVCVSG